MHNPTFIKIGSRIIAAICPGFSRKRRSTLGKIIERGNNHIRDGSLWHAASAGNGIRRVGIAIIFRLGFYADERSVMQSVVSAFKF